MNTTDEYTDGEIESVALKFDDFVMDLMTDANEAEFNILDLSAILISRLCRYAVESGYNKQLAALLDIAADSMADADQIEDRILQ